MRAYLTCHLTGSREFVSLGIGDLIGRSAKAALCIDDPRISEAHAFVSLRGGELVLLALRGRFRHRGRVVAEVVLRSGVDIELYKDFWLHCDDVVVPQRLLGLSIPGLGVMALTHTSSLVFDTCSSTFSLEPGHLVQAEVVFWSMDGVWSVRSSRDGVTEVLEEGRGFEVGGLRVECVGVDANDGGVECTRGSERAPLFLKVGERVVGVRSDVHEQPVLVSGVPGRIFASVSSYTQPIEWETVARRVWFEDLCSEGSLRRRFDVGMLRLREKLRQLGLPEGLVRMDGSGLVSLHLEPGDDIEFIPSFGANS